MESLNELIEQGKALGYEDEQLQNFVKDQQALLREERAAKRQQEKENLEMKAAFDRERIDQEMKKKQLEHDLELDLLTKKSELKSVKSEDQTLVKPKVPKLPAYDDVRDDMDSYLRRFERYAEVMKWDKAMWATNLSALLKGRALDEYALLPPDQACDYVALKTALLKRFDLTEDGFKRKFRSCRPEGSETFAQYSVRLSSYLQRWIEMSRSTQTFDGLYDLVMREQFLQICNRDLSLFLKERTPGSISEMATLADQFREARLTNALSLTSRSLPSGQIVKVPQQVFNKENKSENQNVSEKKLFVPKSERRCYKCGQLGHIASECKPKLKDKCQAIVSEGGTDENIEPDTTQTCGACIIPSDCVISNTAILSNSGTSLVSSCGYKSSVMPTSSGFVDGNPVNVLRDTGCSGIVVRQSKIDETNLTGKFQVCVLADGTKVKVPVAMIMIDTPYLSGKYEAWCMQSPVYDLIIGNVKEVRSPGNPDPKWSPVHAVETRQQTKQKGKPPDL
ncbi:hypothetical protein FSP39_002389 [Pinctada imbricata]|uniref:CCHC-type domain-containing protein n=1 Tax=Pinctada imbricata TaxID=66713 RepID=A0AA89C674_PINIB|nr:hypothetical protein FSP39_002389 [Pinctada imbricata]